MQNSDIEGGGQNDRTDNDKINCHFVRGLIYTVVHDLNALDFIRSIYFFEKR